MNLCKNVDFHKSLDNLVSSLKSYPLSNYDLTNAHPNIRITTSADLPKLRFADQLFNGNIGVLLWLNEENSGHWLGLIRKQHTIEIFDSYGFPFKNINKHLNSQMNISPDVLLNLIKKSGYKPIFNKKIYQNRTDKSNATCGRWVLLRFAFSKYNLKEFDRILKHIKNKTCINSLELSVLYTNEILNK